MGQLQFHKGRNETIDYIQAMLEQLYPLAKRQGCDVPAYLIEMACIEAGDMTRKVICGPSTSSDLTQKKGDRSA